MSSSAADDNTSLNEQQGAKGSGHICQTLNCGKLASLQCPTCLKLGIKDESHFCNQVSYLHNNLF